MARLSRGGRGLAGVVVLLLAWEAFSRSGVILQDFFPPPTTVFGTLGRLLVTQEFLRDLIATVLAWLISVGIAVAIAVPAGLVLGSVKVLRLAAAAIVEFLRPIPSIAWWPLAYVLLEGGPQTKIALAVYAAVWPILFNIVYALNEVDQQYVETARSFGMRRLEIMARIKVPDVLPFAITGLRIAATFALLVIVSIELVYGGIAGLGTYVVKHGEETGRMDIVLAAAVVAALLGYLGNGGLAALQRRLVVWAPGELR